MVEQAGFTGHPENLCSCSRFHLEIDFISSDQCYELRKFEGPCVIAVVHANDGVHLALHFIQMLLFTLLQRSRGVLVDDLSTRVAVSLSILSHEEFSQLFAVETTRFISINVVEVLS